MGQQPKPLTKPNGPVTRSMAEAVYLALSRGKRTIRSLAAALKAEHPSERVPSVTTLGRWAKDGKWSEKAIRVDGEVKRRARERINAAIVDPKICAKPIPEEADENMKEEDRAEAGIVARRAEEVVTTAMRIARFVDNALDASSKLIRDNYWIDDDGKRHVVLRTTSDLAHLAVAVKTLVEAQALIMGQPTHHVGVHVKAETPEQQIERVRHFDEIATAIGARPSRACWPCRRQARKSDGLRDDPGP